MPRVVRVIGAEGEGSWQRLGVGGLGFNGYRVSVSLRKDRFWRWVAQQCEYTGHG